MTITLLIIFTTFVARDVLMHTVQSIQDKVDMTVYIESDAKNADVQGIAAQIDGLQSVREVAVSTPSDYRNEFIEQNKSDPKSLNSLNNSDPQFPWRLRIKMVDINNTAELEQFVDSNAKLKDVIDENTPPSFAGPQRTAIERIGGWVKFADRAGIIAGSVFVVISSLIIFNTIRMAIFNRREEIQMMKLIGAERSFIRGPFVVEAIVYGFIAAIIATGLGIFGVYAARDVLEKNGIAIADTASLLITYSPLVLGAMIIIGALIGIISSLLATQKYLKV
jgi:cell division transport system permease protein